MVAIDWKMCDFTLNPHQTPHTSYNLLALPSSLVCAVPLPQPSVEMCHIYWKYCQIIACCNEYSDNISFELNGFDRESWQTRHHDDFNIYECCASYSKLLWYINDSFVHFKLMDGINFHSESTCLNWFDHRSNNNLSK